jgi:translation initiation factor IF-3
MGVYPIRKALDIAIEQGMDLVEISPNAVPPVCKIVDYNKFLYEKKKKEKEIKAHAKKVEVKEIRFTPNTDEHDVEFKAKHAENFIKEGNKVKAFVMFRGRAIVFKERGELLLLQFADRLKDVAVVEQLPALEGKKMFMTLAPKGKKK